MNFSDLLLENIQERKRQFAFNPYDRDGVIKNLVFLYHVCIASEELLREAYRCCLNDLPDTSDLARYYLEHLEEERGEVPILKEDLASAGIEPEMPDAISMAMIGTQYYLLKHMSPYCLLGYMAIQEADPTDIKVVKLLETLHGKSLFRFLRLHAIKDLEHRKELIQVIDAAPRAPISFSADNALKHLHKAATTFYGDR